MLDARGLYEIAIRVEDLAKGEPFYMDVLASSRPAKHDGEHGRAVGTCGPEDDDGTSRTSAWQGPPPVDWPRPRDTR